MKRRFLCYTVLIILLATGCHNQLRELNGAVIKTAGAVHITDPQNDYVIDAAIPIPTQVSATQGDFSDRIRISWQQVFYNDSQIQYHVYRESKTKDGEATLLRLTGYRPIVNLYFDDLVSGTVEPGVVYRYYVRAVNMSSPNTEGSVLSAPVEGFALAGVSTISADFRVSTEKVTVTWGEVEGASFYYLYRAEEVYEGVRPPDEDFIRLDQAFTECSYNDYSLTSGGILKAGKSYYYYVEACFDRETTAERSGYARGALLSAGAPTEGYIEDVSQDEILGAIRVAWTADANAKSYFVYRITQENLEGGDYVGTEIAVDPASLKSDNGAAVWYDTDPIVATGESFYYRVAAINDYGAGSLSSPNISEVSEQLRVAGRAIPSAADLQPYIMLQRTGFYVSWPQVFSGAGYYLMVADGTSGSAPAEESGWTLIGSSDVTATEMTVSESDLSSVLNGTQIADAKLYFRVLPVNTTLVTAYDPATGVTLSEDGTKYQTELNGAGSEGDSNTILVGRSNFMQPMYFEKRAPSLISIEASQGTEIGTVKVTAELDLNSEIGYLYDIKLKRTCYYGDETGVYPLSLPPANTKASDAKVFTKNGQAKQARTSTISMSEYFNSGVIEWNDPMPDYDKNGNEVGTITWDYATWDREAWKCILRKKDVDMRQFMNIEYTLISIDLNNGNKETVLNASPATGYPDLSNKEFAHLAKWMTDCALNSIWQLNIPRCLWDNTVSWLPGLSFSHNGENGGRMVFNVGSVTNLSGSGGTDGTQYSDWPGYTIKLSMSMKVSLESNQPRQVTLNGVQLVTPYFSGSMDLQMTVRDFGPFWGLWSESDGSYKKGGYLTVKAGRRSSYQFNPSEIIMKGTGATDVFDYQVHGYDLNRDLDPSEKSSYPTKGGGSWHFTRINWPARPYPENNSFMSGLGKSASIDYGTTPW